MERAVAWELERGSDLEVASAGLRYEFVKRDGDRCVVRYGGSARGESYDIVFDRDGLAIDYPGLARRVAR